MSNLLYQYQNGNVNVSIFSDGTKIREFEEVPIPQFPESIDLKITNYCEGIDNIPCKFCHEVSNIAGQHADLDVVYNKIKDLPSGIELAIGGGNPLSHPELECFLIKLHNLGFICNLTINQNHIIKYQNLINNLLNNKLIYGLGISISDSENLDNLQLISIQDNIVYHLICGIHEHSLIEKLLNQNNECKVLILGYKNFGRGKLYYSNEVENNKYQWFINIRKYLGRDNLVISFDNLALDQLNIKRFVPDELWNELYMGDDFSHTMYIDAVKQTYAPMSTSNDRVSFEQYDNVIKYFAGHEI